jgi:CRISPR/Cas system-associated exonuclease Cas4 (RecB family)
VKSTKQTKLRTFFPKQLSTFERCPEQFYFEFVEKRPKPVMPFNAPRERGRVIHNIFNGIAAEFSKNGERPTNQFDRASAALDREHYSTEEEWLSDVQIIVKEVEFGLGVFDDKAQILASENSFEYPHKQDDDCPSFVLGAKPDLVMLRCDDDGLLYFDIVDFKTGKGWSDSIQEIATRIVVKRNAKRFRAPFNFICNTTVRTGVSDIDSKVLDPDDCAYRWQHIKDLVKEIAQRYDWPPKKNWSCKTCPYRECGCTLSPDEFDD